MWWGSLGIVAAIVSLGAAATGVRGQAGLLWRTEQRVLITNFSEMLAAARGPRHVFAVTPNGVVAYDFAFDRWAAPLTAVDGFPADALPTALAYDPIGGILWLGTANGSLLSLTPGIDRWDRVAGTGFSAILEIVPFRRDGTTYVATERGWLGLRAGSFIADRLSPAEVPAEVRRAAEDSRARRDPFLDAARGTVTLDAGMRRWPIADVEPAEAPGEYWVATAGGGLVLYDTRFQRSEWHPFGTLARGAGALAIRSDRIWFGGDGRGPRDGVTLADTSLQHWRQFHAADGAPRGPVRDILATGDSVWFAAEDGLFLLAGTRASQASWQRFTARDGLPSDVAFALAQWAGDIWVGTTRGLVRRGPDGSWSTNLLPGIRVNALAAAGEVVWAATDEGLFQVAAEAHAISRPPGAPGGRLLDVVARDGAVYAVAEDAYYRLDRDTWSGPERGPALARLGRLGRAAVAEGAFWLGGENGLGRLDLETGAWAYFIGGTDLPRGPVRDLAPAGDDVWASTPAGAFRFRWRR